MFKVNNPLLYVMLVPHLLMAISFYYSDPNGLLDIRIDVTEALYLHISCTFSFLLGYFFFRISPKKKNIHISCLTYTFPKRLFFFSIVVASFGIIVTLVQISLSISLSEYILRILSGEFVHGLRDSFLRSSEEGGLPGILKMFNNAPLAFYLFSIGLLSTVKLDEQSFLRLKKLSKYCFLLVLIKVFFTLDRLSIMALIISYGLQEGLKGIRFRSLFIIVVLFFLANFISSFRLLGYTIFDFVFLYMKLGLINLQLNIDNSFDFTFGFETLLHPLKYITPGVVSLIGVETPAYSWFWNNALYFVSYGYLDFGFFVILAYFIVGVVSSFLDYGVKRNYISSASFSLIFAYGLGSFTLVPAIRGVEFTLALLLAFTLYRRLKVKHDSH